MNKDFLDEANDPLDALLRDANEHIPDAGFTGRVMQSLPPRRQRWSPRFFIISFAMLVCGGLAVWQSPPLPMLLDAWRYSWSDLGSRMLLFLVPLALALGTLIWGACALAREERV